MITKEAPFTLSDDAVSSLPGQRDRAVDYLENLPLADFDVESRPGRAGLYLPTGDTFGTSKVTPANGNSAAQDTIVAPDAMGDANYTAVMRTKLLAQMGARTEFDVNRETDKYYQKYMEILGYCGWVQNYSKWRQYTSSSSSLEISRVLIDLLTGLLVGPQLELLETALTVLKTGYSSNEQIRLLGKDKAADKEVNFDLGVVGEDSHAWPTFKPVFFAISAESETVNILFATLKSSQTSVFYATSDQTLDMSHYAKVKATVEAKTEEAAKKYIENLPIAD
ncbi:hypothetical protein [Amycolatopsis australiensis]|uniref:Uncharacterized protein n=1 Tax=Amycolatopsis australiensis TaxID=546364 RepID=A0A1K1SRC3_9PSEU|nr:hypothetical protein [Amycolatopsis australiensis]SFW86838.1 hypothetical protein SAMN04489730_6516 [Amycolatopsis australiensis]